MFKVTAERCEQCLFGKAPIVSPARIKEVIAGCVKKDTFFVCHKTDDVCCRGFYDTNTSQQIRIAQRLNVVEFVQVPK